MLKESYTVIVEQYHVHELHHTVHYASETQPTLEEIERCIVHTQANYGKIFKTHAYVRTIYLIAEEK